MYSDKVVIDASYKSNPVTTKPVNIKYKKTLEKVLQRGDNRRRLLVNQTCSCKTESYNWTNVSKIASLTSQSSPNRSKILCMKKRFPKALLVGMTKGGTTALMSFINEHPTIVARTVRPFDTRYFNHYYDDKSYDWYKNLMPCSYAHQITVSRCTEYFFTSSVPERVRAFDPSMKLIVIVREPVARALSQYVMWKYQAEYRIGNFSFEDAITAGPNKDIDPTSRLIVVSNYQRHMQIWLKYFNLSQFLILDSLTFVTNPVKELNKLEDFLGVDRFFTENNFVYNAKRQKYCVLSRDGVAKCQHKKKGMPHPPLKKDLKIKLENFFKPRNNMFFKMINKSYDWGY
ncbi:heparan sulfate glucosamine 3-O-sulfotransferase 6-like [Ruditapes philippinarum]|uniref:heparan sulfate glucosamine 3-O-sulfotransferase 6-like n=1 Tax=Ruditapes philippinarum TaxID=129788 RepID=UPI00295B1CB2|nr:heparan sulfate glucosamine 3-O-sulfotransferase 6-like [Ruditapes philippinarum]